VTAVRRCSFIFIWIWCLSAIAAEVIPPKPAHYFNDYAQVVNAGTADQLNAQLENFERATGNQFVVAVYPKMQSDSSIDDYTVRVFRSWKVGQKGTNNGVVLFAFIQDHQMFVQVGYGLEGVLPDALCKQITEYEIKPHFKTGDYAGGLIAGVNAIVAASQHEYKGNGTTVASGKQKDPGISLLVIGFVCFVILIIILGAYRRKFPILDLLFDIFQIACLFSGNGSRSSFRGGGGSGGGGFSGGGGSSGGGGAGSSW